MIKKSESGQAIVLLVFAVVALIGFTALAIDGGMVYSDRRHAQSASDASSLAAGGYAALALENYQIFYNNGRFICGSSDMIQIISESITMATQRALSNDYTNAETIVTASCVQNGPTLDEKYIDFITHITRETNTSLIHFVYDGPATNEVESTVRVRPRHPLALGNAIVAVNEEECQGNQNGISLNGGSVINVTGGGIFSNGCFDCDGLSCPHEEDGDCVNVDGGGSVSYAGTNICDRNDRIEPAPGPSDPMQDFFYYVETPNCYTDGAVRIPSITSGVNLNAAYPDKTLICLTSSGNAIRINNVHDNLTGVGITIYLENSGDIRISGGIVNLDAPGSDPDPFPGIPGVLIHVNPANPSVITINGNSDSSYFGTIYAPNADIEVTGTGDIDDPTVYNTQIIGNNVNVGGNAYIDISYLDGESYSKPTFLDMQE